MNNGYQFDSPLLSATIADDCTLLSADAIFSSDSMQSITVCKMDVPANEIIIPSVAIEPIQNAVIVEAPVVAKASDAKAPKVTEVSVAEAPKVTEVPVVEAPKVIKVPKITEVPVAEVAVAEAPKVTEVPVAEAPKVTEVPVAEAPKVTEAPKVEVSSIERNQEADGEEDADGEEEADGDQEVEEEEEGEEVEEISYNGETYHKDADGFIYKPEDDTPIGYWKEKTQSIAFYRAKK